MKRNPLWDAQAKQHIASGNTGPMLPNALAHQAVPGAGWGALGGAALGASAGGGGRDVQNFNSKQDALRAFNARRQPTEAELRQAYLNGTGREADEEGLQAHMANPGGREAALEAIYNSPEAQAYNRQQYDQRMAGGPQSPNLPPQDMQGQAGPLMPKEQKVMPDPGGQWSMGPEGPVAPKVAQPPQAGWADIAGQAGAMLGPGGPAMQKQQVDPRMRQVDPRMREEGRRLEQARRQQMANQGTPFQYRVQRG